ncbi:MAG: radical SAM protein [Deltaproteobacteria bacterium]|nr:radical SAM protein [Deltaproteobacteria bacterium]
MMDESKTLKEISYGDLGNRVHADGSGVAERRVPTDGMLELTRLCSLKCTHCYIGDARWKKDPRELSTDQLKALMDALAERGTLWLTFTGGEALLRKDFKELWLYAKQKGFALVLFSNATLIDDKMAGFLELHPPQCLEISIYGATRETYERVTLIPGSFDRFMRGIENVRKRGLPWVLKAPVIKELAGEIPQITALASEWGVRLVLDGEINASIGEGQSGGKAPCASRLSEERLVDFALEDKNLLIEIKGMARERATAAMAPKTDEPLFSCGAGSNMFYVNSRGDLQMCVLTHHRSENLYADRTVADGFDATWAKFGDFRKIKMRADSPCIACDLTGICKSCPGFAHLENGDEHSAVEWLCRSTHLKALKTGLPHRCDIKHFVYTPPKKP